MNPHFIFNALNSIQEFILLSDKKMANSYLGKFADLMRLILDMSNTKEVKLETEIKALQLYLELEAMRFEDNFEYQIYCNEAIDIEHTFIPSMLIQPYVENAIKQGLLHQTGLKQLWIRFFYNPEINCIECEIEDNGIGRKQPSEINRNNTRKHQSFAMSATQKRLELLNHARKKAISVDIIDKVNENQESDGTKVILHIPFSDKKH